MHPDSMRRMEELVGTYPDRVAFGKEAGKTAVEAGLRDGRAVARGVGIASVQVKYGAKIPNKAEKEQVEAIALGILSGVEEAQGREVEV